MGITSFNANFLTHFIKHSRGFFTRINVAFEFSWLIGNSIEHIIIEAFD